MGFRISWLAFHGINRAECLTRLGLAETGQIDEANEEPFSLTDLPSGWHILFVNDVLYASEQRASALSKDCTVVASQINETTMYSRSALYRDGAELWTVTHDSEKGLRHLDISGDIPAEVAGIREDLLTQLEANGGDASDTDYIFDVPVELAFNQTGYRHDRWKFDWGEPEFHEVKPLSASASAPWWRKLLGG